MKKNMEKYFLISAVLTQIEFSFPWTLIIDVWDT